MDSIDFIEEAGAGMTGGSEVDFVNKEEFPGAEEFYEGPEGAFAAKHQFFYPFLRTVSDFVPFLRFAWPTGRAEFREKTPGMKAFELGLDVAGVTLGTAIGRGLLGKGLNSAFKLLKSTREGTKFVPEALNVIDKLHEKMIPFVNVTPESYLIREAKWTGEEAAAYAQGRLPEYLENVKRFGWHTQPSKGLLNSIDQKALKEGELKFTGMTANKLKDLGRPIEERTHEHFVGQYEDFVRAMAGKEVLSNTFKENTFKVLMREYFGEAGEGFTLNNSSPQVIANLTSAMMDKPRRLRKLSDIGFKFLFPKFHPVRFVAGSGEARFGTMAHGYVPLKTGYESSNYTMSAAIDLYLKDLVQKGLGRLKGKARPRFKWTAPLEDYHEAGRAMHEMDQMIGQGIEAQELRNWFLAKNENVQKAILAAVAHEDYTYLNFFKSHIPYLFRKVGVQPSSLSPVDELMEKVVNGERGLANGLRDYLSPARDLLPYGEQVSDEVFKPGKAELIEDALSKFRDLADEFGEAGLLEQDQLDRLLRYLTQRGQAPKARFPNYLRNFSSEIYGIRAATNAEVVRKLLKESTLARFYATTGRGKDPLRKSLTDLSSRIESNARALGRSINFYPQIERVANYGQQWPVAYREYFAHYIFRLLGAPSPVDYKVARWIEGLVGPFQEMFGGKGLWDENRIQDLAYNINNMVYMGGLGFKPFSAIRNLFQAPMLVPPDLGSPLDLKYLLKGFWEVARGREETTGLSTRLFIRDHLKAIQEFAPEYYTRVKAVPMGASFKIGKLPRVTLPEQQQLRDVAMWMFKLSDRWNRYLAGGAAKSKWEHFAGKFIKTLEDGSINVNPRFISKMKIKGRNPWVRDDLLQYLGTKDPKQIQAAKELFMMDVISDTQYLYGITDAPIVSHTWGALGKMGLVFQSWWMNYGALLEKWLINGQVEGKAQRMFTAMMSMAIAQGIMEQIWSKGTVRKTTFLGPFPGEVSEFTAVPPVFAPFYHALTGALAFGRGDIDTLERHLQSGKRSLLLFVPAGLQLGAISRELEGIKDLDWERIAKAAVRYNPEQ